MLKFVLSFLEFSARISALVLLAVLDLLFHLGQLRVELSDDVLLLFLFELKDPLIHSLDLLVKLFL